MTRVSLGRRFSRLIQERLLYQASKKLQDSHNKTKLEYENLLSEKEKIEDFLKTTGRKQESALLKKLKILETENFKITEELNSNMKVIEEENQVIKALKSRRSKLSHENSETSKNLDKSNKLLNKTNKELDKITTQLNIKYDELTKNTNKFEKIKKQNEHLEKLNKNLVNTYEQNKNNSEEILRELQYQKSKEIDLKQSYSKLEMEFNNLQNRFNLRKLALPEENVDNFSLSQQLTNAILKIKGEVGSSYWFFIFNLFIFNKLAL